MSVYGELTFCLYVFYPVSSGLSKMVPVSVVLSPLCQTADSAYNKGVEKKKKCITTAIPGQRNVTSRGFIGFYNIHLFIISSTHSPVNRNNRCSYMLQQVGGVFTLTILKLVNKYICSGPVAWFEILVSRHAMANHWPVLICTLTLGAPWVG